MRPDPLSLCCVGPGGVDDEATPTITLTMELVSLYKAELTRVRDL